MESEVYKIRLARWKSLVYEANNSGMVKNEWCRLNGISARQFYYWQKKVRELELNDTPDKDAAERETLPSFQTPAFVELKIPPQPCASRTEPGVDRHSLNPLLISPNRIIPVPFPSRMPFSFLPGICNHGAFASLQHQRTTRASLSCCNPSAEVYRH